MKEILRRVVLFASLILVGMSSHGADQAKITIKTVDENGAVLSGMPVSAKFYQAHGAKGTSDTNGLFVLEGEAKMGEVNYSSQKEGYYRSEGRYTFSPAWSPKGGRFEPWNPTVTAVVRRVVNPIPMYAKRVEAIIPVTNTACGFDLTAGDWVTPNGKGKFGDLVFRVVGRRVVSWTDCEGTLLMTFSNEKDGLQIRDGIVVGGSSFPWSYTAPEEGYSRAVKVSMGYAAGKGLFETNHTAASYFRVRSVTNEEGKVVSAYYGKIPGPLKFDVREGETGWVGFAYYLNPTPNDRNLEFDSKRNLFTNLGESETVSEP